MTGPNGGKRKLVAERRYPNASKPVKKPKKKAKTPTPRKKPVRRKPTRKSPSNPVVRLVSGLFRWIGRLIWLTVSRGALALAVVIGIAVFYIYSTLPPYSELLDGRARGSVTLLDRNSSVFAWRGEQFGGQITADTVSPHLKHAIIATEDKRFYRHFGVSPRGIASAIRINLSEGRGPLSGHGGSTLTQQTAKLLCLGVPYDPNTWKNQTEYEADCRETTMARKIKEMVFAMAMEARYSKDEILSIYMNRAYLGAGANGFEAAAQRYFGKSAAEVNIAESAMLAGLLQAPTRYAPTNNLQRSQERAGIVLLLMSQQGYITEEERAYAKAHPAELSETAEKRAGGYFADWVMGSGPDFLTRDTTEDVVIETTFDQRIQSAAEEALTWIFENKVRAGSEAQAAIVVMSADGAVRAMVGGRKLKVSGAFNRATQAKRQPGSSFKPFVYATALDMGWSYDDVIMDEPITLDIPGSGPWSPQNYDRKFHGPVTVTDALKHSYNIPAVKLAMDAGLENVRTVAEMFGIESDLAQGPALALGASETTLLEMTGAYAGILNGGSSVTPYGLKSLRLKGDSTPLMGQEGGLGERVITPDSAQQLIYMMYNAVQSGTGARAQIPGVEVAGKTGTTQAARDAWFMGFTADYVAGVWMGYDDNSPLTGVTGGGLPAEIWQRTMAQVQEGLEPKPLPMIRPATPPTVNAVERNTNTGRGGDKADNVLLDLLGTIFGGGN
ncbi:transglycosylase domain-containing protein [Celeribacter halophilus]|uniref:transglycosylase domain-containing protein n=1 Tax=Celeribacter halophilus TaxID=576117 RepID=UPI001C09DAC8|nr:PBP1A family penicillin-binding protein [Celeribacter halophilus]MBU2890004.1 PBP1A family penicillin-binding protein [Celeribacter halophilus]MDO6511383.1 PBP1A family penicillin-binding protein [Celeribacter halophilus]